MTDEVIEFPGHIGPGDLPSEQPRRRFVEKRHLIKRDFTGLSPSQRCQTPADLPGWVRTALVRKTVFDLTFKEVAKAFVTEANDPTAEIKKAALLKRYAGTPGGKQWIEAVNAKKPTDPVAVARYAMMLHSDYVTYESLIHLEAAKKAGDRGEVGRMLRELLKVTGVQKPENAGDAPLTITVNIQNNVNGPEPLSVDFEMGGSDYQVVEAEILED